MIFYAGCEILHGVARRNSRGYYRSLGFSSTLHGNDIAGEAQRTKLRLVIETAQEVWGSA